MPANGRWDLIRRLKDNHHIDAYKSRGKTKRKAIPLQAWTGS